MTKQVIITTPHLSGSGTPGFTAFEMVNANFTELYGTGAGVVSSAGVGAVATYAAARLLSGVTTGDRLQVLGRTSQSDGGQGLFTWVAGGTTTINDGTQLSATGGIWQRTPDQQTTPRMFGAKGDGINDDTAAIQAAWNTGYCYIGPGTWKITSNLVAPSGAWNFIGAGSGLTTLAISGSVSGIGILFSTTNVRCIAGGFLLTGTVTNAVRFSSFIQGYAYDINLFTTGTDGFQFLSSFGSNFSAFTTESATLSNAAFHVGGGFNGNVVDRWYTHNITPFAFLLDDTVGGGGGGSSASTFNGLVAQSVDMGLSIHSNHSQHTFNSYYSENVGCAARIGNSADAGGVATIGHTFNSPLFDGGTSGRSLPTGAYSCLWLDAAWNCTFNAPNFVGSGSVYAAAPVTLTPTGGDTPSPAAIAYAYVSVAGVIQNIVVIVGGAGYNHVPTVSFGGAGTGASATATISGGAVTGFTGLVGGSGFVFASMAVQFVNTAFITINNPILHSNVQNAVYPWVIRNAGTSGGSRVDIVNDVDPGVGQCDVRAAHPSNFVHTINSYSGAASVQRSWTPTLYTG